MALASDVQGRPSWSGRLDIGRMLIESEDATLTPRCQVVLPEHQEPQGMGSLGDSLHGGHGRD